MGVWAEVGLWGESMGARRWRRKNCGGKRMMRPCCARRSQVDAGRNLAAVCSLPPSEVGTGMMVSASASVEVPSAEEMLSDCESGSR